MQKQFAQIDVRVQLCGPWGYYIKVTPYINITLRFFKSV